MECVAGTVIHFEVYMLKSILNNPYVSLLGALALLFTAGYETWVSWEDAENRLAAHHGILFFGLIQTAKLLPDVIDSLSSLDDAAEAVKEDN